MLEGKRFSAERLKALRERAGSSRPALAGRSGLGASTIKQLEDGTHEPTHGTLVKLDRGPGVFLSALLPPEQERPARRGPKPKGK